MNTFDIVIVNWNSGDQLFDCVSSVFSSSFKFSVLNKVIIVDNASSDDSLSKLESITGNFQVLKNSCNVGFGKACNQGAEKSTSEYILFLNPDVIVFNDTFDKLFKEVKKNRNQKTAVYGVQLLDHEGRVQRNCARIPTLRTFIIRTLGLNKFSANWFKSYTMEEWDHSHTSFVDQVMGAFFLIENRVFKKLAGFDERFFVYYEELDLSRRIKQNGYNTLFIAEAQSYHKSGGTSEKVKAKRLFYNIRSRIIFSFKHFGIFKGFLLMLFTFVAEPITRILHLLLKRNFIEVGETIKGFTMLYGDSSNIIKLGMKK